MTGRLLVRLGGLLIVAAVVYLPASRLIVGEENFKVFRNLAGAGLVCMAVGAGLWIAGRGMARIVSQSCPRCGRRVGRGRVYCEDHLQDTINEYRDQQRGKGS
ncbi:MAG TPA: hypothetical protein VGV60_18205 [Candidatus Polarisedimenticolia bacterium]|nr:hypothetical protein [Candidatus Polarisedimenticolia bacterium]